MAIKEPALEPLAKVIFVVAITMSVMGGAGTSVAQTPAAKAPSNGVAEQFKSGANQVSEGATQIGEGIKDGAITTWQAIKAGAAAAAAQFSGGQRASTGSPNPTPLANPAH